MMKFSIGAKIAEYFEPNQSKSSYAGWNGETFKRILEPEKNLPLNAQKAYEDFRAHVSGEDFSCIGAKAALNGNLFRFGFYEKMNTPATNLLLAEDLQFFAGEQKNILRSCLENQDLTNLSKMRRVIAM